MTSDQVTCEILKHFDVLCPLNSTAYRLFPRRSPVPSFNRPADAASISFPPCYSPTSLPPPLYSTFCLEPKKFTLPDLEVCPPSETDRSDEDPLPALHPIYVEKPAKKSGAKEPKSLTEKAKTSGTQVSSHKSKIKEFILDSSSDSEGLPPEEARKDVEKPAKKSEAKEPKSLTDKGQDRPTFMAWPTNST